MATAMDRSRTRRERTFVGSECAVCEEPLEHTLRGERVLQFSCQHVSHEACFYEFIREFEGQYCPTCDSPLHLDTSRGGNVIDIGSSPGAIHARSQGTNASTEKISNMVRSVGVGDSRSVQTPTPNWDAQTVRPPSVESGQRRQQPQSQQAQQPPQQQPQHQHVQSIASSRDGSTRGYPRDSRDAHSASDRYGSRHGRSDSEATGVTGMASSVSYPETTQSGPPRRHDYDLQAMETTPGSPRPITRNPIPAPSVTVRSEFPTLNRSRQQQTLTCLVTIEVPDNKWRPDPEDLGAAAPQGAASQSGNARIDEVAARPPSPARSAPKFYPYESQEVLEEMTESLRNRVDNWHGLDFSR